MSYKPSNYELNWGNSNNNLIQFSMLTGGTKDATPARYYADNYEQFKNYYSLVINPDSISPPLKSYTEWITTPFFPSGANVISSTDISPTIPSVNVTPTGNTWLAAGGSTTLATATLSNVVVGTTGCDNIGNIKSALDRYGSLSLGTGSYWKVPEGKTIYDSPSSTTEIILYQYNITSNVTLTCNNVVFRNIFFNIQNSNNTITITGNNVVFDNCIIEYPANTGDGVIHFNANGVVGDSQVKNCVIRNTTANINPVELFGTTGLPLGSNIHLNNNWITTNISLYNPTFAGNSNLGWIRSFFYIFNNVTSDVLGNIYVYNNNFVDAGFVNGQAYSDGSTKALVSWRVKSSKTFGFKCFIIDNAFTQTGLPNQRDYAVFATDSVPQSWLDNGGYVYVKNSNIPNTYKKVMVYFEQTVSPSNPIFYLV